MTKNSYVWVDVIIRTNYFVSCGTHFVKQQFSEVSVAYTLQLFVPKLRITAI